MSLPAIVSSFVLYLNYKQKPELAYILYFILCPFVTCFIYLYGMNPGTTLLFILYGVLSVFFLKDKGYLIFSLCFSMVCYFLLAVIINSFPYELQAANYPLYVINQAITILFIFHGLFLIKNETRGYQTHMLDINTSLREKNMVIMEQSYQINQDAIRLEKQANQLKELNELKDKMFSIISHDLRAPVYGLRTIFQNVADKQMSLQELKILVPEIQNDMNYVVSLMDNLLHWAKAQMENNAIHPQEIDVRQSIQEVIQQIHLQAKSKHITIIDSTPENLYSHADKNMIAVVIRNLLSNAIKFTPENGSITIGVIDHHSFIEIFIKDKGNGISDEAMMKINKKAFYTTKGTNSEAGTGLGLLLCKEFLERNGSQLHIESEPGVGSTFSFSLVKAA